MPALNPIAATVGQQRVTVFENPDYQPDLFSRTTEFLDSGYGGSYRLGQFGKRLADVVTYISPNEAVTKVGNVFGSMSKLAILPTLPGAWSDAKKSVTDLLCGQTLAPANRARQIAKTVVEVTNAVASSIYGAVHFTPLFEKSAGTTASLLSAATPISFVHDVTEMGLIGQEFNATRVTYEAARTARVANEVQDALCTSQRVQLFKLIKTVLNVATAILGVLAASSFSVPGLGFTLVLFPLLATMSAIAASMKQAGSQYGIVKMHDLRHVRPLAMG